MKNKIITALAVSFFGLLALGANDVITDSNHNDNSYSMDAFTLKLKEVAMSFVDDLDDPSQFNKTPIINRLREDLDRYEKEYNESNDKLMLAFKAEKGPEYVKLMEQIFPAIYANPDGTKDLESLPNGELLKSFLKFYHPSSKHFNDLKFYQQEIITAVYEVFKPF